MTWRSYSALDIYCLPLSSLCKTVHWHWPHVVVVCRVSCGGVVNMLLVFSITFYFHYNIWGGMCATGPFQYRWLKGYTCSSCYYHHQIGSIHCCHIFPWLCVLRCLLHHNLLLIAYTFRENRELVFIFIVQFMMSANSRIRFVLNIAFVYFYIVPHYHHCSHLSEDIELIKCLSDIFVERVSKIKHSLSVIYYTMWGCVFSVYPFPLWCLREYKYFALLSSSNRKYEILPIFKG